MEFQYIDDDLSYSQVESLKGKLRYLSIDLGINETNTYCCSGLGGNNFLLLMLMSMDIDLISSTDSIKFFNGQISFGADWFENSSIIDIRKELDKVSKSFLESQKYISILLESIVNSNSLIETIKKYGNEFPTILSCLDNKNYKFDSDKMSEFDKLVVAFTLCQELSIDLDNNNLSKIDLISSALLDFNTAIILLSVRRYIGLSRIIKFNLDERPIFNKLLTKVLRDSKW